MIYVTDVETYEKSEDGHYHPVLDSNKYTLGVVMSENGDYKVFYTPEDHLKYIMELYENARKNGKKIYLYGHNHLYDFFAYAKPLLYDNKLFRVNDTGALLYIYDSTLYFLDTSSFYRMALSKVGELLGIPKLTMPDDIHNMDSLITYCKRDCEITLKAVLRVKETLSSIGFSPRKLLTAGSVAISTLFSHLRRNNQHYDIMYSGKVYCSNNHQKLRLAFRGGRFEAFHTGYFEKATLVDINSLYPYCMATMPFPKLDEGFYIENPASEHWLRIINSIGVSCATVVIPKQLDFGYLPVFYQNEQHFPTSGILKGTWTNLELKEAKDLGYRIKDIHWTEIYPTSSRNPFTEYITKIYKMRSQPDLNLTMKFLLNNLYGKFAQMNEDKDILTIERALVKPYLHDNWKVIGTLDQYYVLKKVKGIYYPKYYNPLISALTTANARSILYRFLHRVGRKDTLLCATDSVLFKGNHTDDFLISSEMGDWKIEHIDEPCIIFGEQRYAIGGKVALSGNTTKVSLNDIKDKRSISIKRMIKYSEALAMGDLSLAGSFREVSYSLESHRKCDTLLPSFIDETLQYREVFQNAMERPN